MTAGAAATTGDAPVSRHMVDNTLPFKPRILSMGERSRRETLSYSSPRNGRIVTLTDPGPIALGLRYEFDATLEVFVERPRRLALTPKQQIDVSFWTRDRDGIERMVLFVPTAGTVPSTTGLAAVRDRDILDAAARRHGFELTYVTERELLSASAERGAHWQLLPHVQHYRRLPTRALVESAIAALLATSPTVTLRRAGQQLAERFTVDQVAAVLAAWVHGGRLRIPTHAGFNEDTVMEVIDAP